MSYYTMTNKELSQTIRKALKEAGFTTKDVSVKVKDSGYNTSVHITVKNPFVRLSEVEAVGKKFEEIEREERTYEILQGCNVFVLCQYDYGIFDEVSAPLLSIAEKVYKNEKYDGRKIADNEEKEVHILQISETESRLYEYKKGSTERTHSDSYVIRCAEALAVAMWRFKNLGTIYA